MIDTYEEIIESIARDGYAVIDDFLTNNLTNGLKANVLNLWKNKELNPAGVGKNGAFQKNEAVRRDYIFWINQHTADNHEIEMLQTVSHFMEYLNRTCYTGLKDSEFHYALYPEGAFYKRHLDQFRFDDSRKFSMICYLNTDWKETDGGELVLYLPEGEKRITPTGGRMVCFESNKIEHEVLPARRDRLSVTGWLKNAAG